MTLEEFEKNAVELFMEYFDHGDTLEVADSLEEFNIRNFKPEVHWSVKVGAKVGAHGRNLRTSAFGLGWHSFQPAGTCCANPAHYIAIVHVCVLSQPSC